MFRNSSLTELKGVGEKTGKLFEKLDIHTVGELLEYYPRDYEAFRKPVRIAEASPGETCAVYAAVSGIPNEKKVRNLHILNLSLWDGTGSLQLTFFNMPFLKKTLRRGGYYVFRGMVQSRGANKIMEQPRIYTPENYGKLEDRLSLRR